MLGRIAIVGRPNVGKSTLFNRIIGERLSIIEDIPGVTRDRLYAKSSWVGREFYLIDTGGIELGEEPFLTEIKAQAEIAMEEADVIVLVVNVRDGITDNDEIIANMLYKVKKPIIVAVNKLDDKSFESNMYEFYQFGFENVVGVSSIHGIGIGDLLDKAIKALPDEVEEKDDDSIKFSLIGRPNVGKSTLTNTILGEERVIVSDIEGTTRDAIDTPFVKNGKPYVIIDTAGMRKRGKVYESTEKYSVLRALAAIDRSNVCLVLLDGEQGIREQDKKIAGYAHQSGKGVIIVVNKWDAVKKDDKTMKRYEQEIRSHFAFLSYAPIVFLSALENKKVQKLFPLIDLVSQTHACRIPTSILNDLLQDAFLYNPPAMQGNTRLKLFYATQPSTMPPTFVLFVNDPELAHFSYKRYLINQLRDQIDFTGTPIHLIFRKRD